MRKDKTLVKNQVITGDLIKVNPIKNSIFISATSDDQLGQIDTDKDLNRW